MPRSSCSLWQNPGPSTDSPPSDGAGGVCMLPILRRLAIQLIEDQSATPLEYAQRLFVRLVAAPARPKSRSA
jgi:hypothetical protein